VVVSALALVAAAAGISGLMGRAFCEATLHVPHLVTARPAGAEDVELTTKDKAVLKGWWFRSGFTGNCVIVLHGIGDSKGGSSGFAPMFLSGGYSVLAPDSRAHGESGGEFVTYGLLERHDVIAWADWMRAQGCRNVDGLGESLGASILIQAAAVKPVFNAIVAECPFADLQAMARYRVQKMAGGNAFVAGLVVDTGMLYADVFDHLDFRQVSPLASMRSSITPVLLIHGLADWRTPAEQSRELFAARPLGTRLWLVPGAGHTEASVVAPAEFRRRVLEWFGGFR
jgi:fermentation-respiration switch protein FrsA (DUF1100 family)